jgi:DNA-directed RNA polymerase sigma subunit (sigma70/sigma32)
MVSLTPDEAVVTGMRFGMDVKREFTPEEIGRQLSLTREMVGRMEKTALRKLRNPGMIRQLQALIPKPPVS